jgi:hypothetical protein
MTKSSEMSREAFGIAVAERLGELRNKALAAGVPKEQLEDIITSVYQQTQELSLTTAVNRIKNAFANKIEAASADLLVGVLVGSRDRVGKNTPIRYLLVKKDKKHVEISNFGTTAQYQGEKIEIPVPALVELKAVHDPEYDSWELKEIVSFRPIDKEGLIKALSSVVIPVKEITKDMAYTQGKAAAPVVITGELSYVRAEVVWKTRGDDEKPEIDHSLPVMNPRETAKTNADTLPCFQFTLKGKGHGANTVRCHLAAMRHGTPLTWITDIIPIANRVVTKHPTDPEAQAKELGEDWLKDLPVIVVGTVGTFKKTYTEDKNERNYVDISVSCVVDIEGAFEGNGTQKPLIPPQKGAPHITTETPPIETKKSAPAPAPEAAPEAEAQDDLAEAEAELAAVQKKLADAKAAKKSAKKAEPAPVAAATATQQAQAAAPSKDIAQIAKMIKVYCRAAGIKPSDVSLDILKTKALDIVDGVPDAVVIEAIGYLKATSAALGE